MSGCDHGRISVVTATGRVTDGLCDLCGQAVEMEVQINLSGRCFWWQKIPADEREEGHPALNGWKEAAPGVWING